MEEEVFDAAELAEGGEDGGAVAACGFLRADLCGGFREDLSGEGFEDGEDEDSHGERVVR